MGASSSSPAQSALPHMLAESAFCRATPLPCTHRVVLHVLPVIRFPPIQVTLLFIIRLPLARLPLLHLESTRHDVVLQAYVRMRCGGALSWRAPDWTGRQGRCCCCCCF